MTTPTPLPYGLKDMLKRHNPERMFLRVIPDQADPKRWSIALDFTTADTQRDAEEYAATLAIQHGIALTRPTPDTTTKEN